MRFVRLPYSSLVIFSTQVLLTLHSPDFCSISRIGTEKNLGNLSPSMKAHFWSCFPSTMFLHAECHCIHWSVYFWINTNKFHESATRIFVNFGLSPPPKQTWKYFWVGPEIQVRQKTCKRNRTKTSSLSLWLWDTKNLSPSQHPFPLDIFLLKAQASPLFFILHSKYLSQEHDVIIQCFSFQYFYCFLEYLGSLTKAQDFIPIHIKISQNHWLNNIY